MGACDSYENKIKEIIQCQNTSLISSSQNGSNQHENSISNNINIIKNEDSIFPEIGLIESLYSNKYQIAKINRQMTNSVCRIINEEITCTGFLCLIPYPTIEHLLKVLITCNHVFNNIKIGNKIKLIFDNKIEKEIVLDKTRKLYKNDKYNIAIIELKDNEFHILNYLKIDDQLYKNEELKENDDQIYILFIILIKVK